MRTIAIINQKGGVGKSTTTMNMAHALSMEGHEVMALDMDPQGHLTTGFGVVNETEAGIDDILMENEGIRDVKMEVRDHMYLIPAGSRLGEFEMMPGGAERGWQLHSALQKGTNGEDFVLIDCPPSAGLLAMNALFAADEILIPVSSDYLALHSLSRFMQILRHVDEALDRKSRIWIALTRFQGRRRLAKEVRDKLIEYFPDNVLATPIRESVALAESPSFGQTIFEYQRKGHGAEDYHSLTMDLLKERTL